MSRQLLRLDTHSFRFGIAWNAPVRVWPPMSELWAVWGVSTALFGLWFVLEKKPGEPR